MFCYKCGKELPDYAKFCNICGANLAAINSIPNEPEKNSIPAETEPMKVDEEKTEILVDNVDFAKPENEVTVNESKKKGRLAFLIAGIAVAFLLIGFVALLLTGKLDFLLKKEAVEAENINTEQSEQTEQTEQADVVSSEYETSEVAPSEPEEQEEEIEEVETVVDDYTPLVAVSVDKTKIYSEANPESTVLASLEVGTCVKWYGEDQLFDKEVFYKVKSIDESIEGYVADSEVTTVHYNGDMSFLSMIETNTTLYTYDMMYRDIVDLCAKYPDILSYKNIGTSYDGRDLYCVTLGNQDAPKHIMVQAAIHGREYMTTQMVMKMIEYYAENYYDGEYDGINYSDLFNTTAFHIVTMSNPDGVTISQLGASALNNSKYIQLVYECYERDKYTMKYEMDSNGDLLWGDYWKQDGFNVLNSDNPTLITFEEYQSLWKGNACGVDINKNFDASWDQVTSKSVPSYADYKGPAPLSDVEACLLYSQALEYEYECFLSYHSRGNLIYYDVNGNSAENSVASGNLALSIHDLNKYTLSNNKSAYNVSLGGFGDWVQLSLNKPSVTIECGKRPCPLKLDELDSMFYRNREVWAMLAKEYMN